MNKKLYFIFAVLMLFSGVLFAEIPLELPPAVYAVPGIETNIYFDNIILTTNSRNYVFDVNCPKGRNDEKRWRFIPTTKDVGSYTFEIKVLDEKNQVVAKGNTKIIVSPEKSGYGKKISILMIGDSLTDQSIYPAAFYELMTASGNPDLTMIGSHSGKGHKPNKVSHEGYGGWTWERFCKRWTNGKDYRARSKFLVMKNGEPQLDFKAYINKYANGKKPDFITVMLGTNDIYRCNDGNIKSRITELFSYADKFISAIKTDAPETQIGIALTVPPAISQDAFGCNYQCGQTRWQFRRNQFHLVEAMIKKYGNGKIKNVSLIPAFTGIDCENNFPDRKEKINSRNVKTIVRQSNGVHPAPEGYKQIADVFYCWLKYQLNK
jgi:lysophospholipase L1-like esterase